MSRSGQPEAKAPRCMPGAASLRAYPGGRRWIVVPLYAAALLAAGCASGPATAPTRDTGGMTRMGPISSAPDRDGAPANPPSDLALLPDPVPQIEPIRPGGPNKPYVVLGQAYEPVVADINWKERGLASWYGTKFHGRRTASGEMFSMYGLTAAHRTLPIPSYARVRNLSNGREIIVRVNDRGPFHSARVMDLSYAAAVKLGISSTAQVEVQRITFEDIRTGAWRRGPGQEPDGVQVAQGAQALPVVAVPAAPPTPLASPAHADPMADPILAFAAVPGPGDMNNAAVAGASRMANVGSLADGPAPARASAGGPIEMAKEGPSRAYTPDAKGFYVQLAALGRREGVDKLQQRVSSEAAGLMPMLAVFHEAALFKLQVGPYRTRGEAVAAAQQARDALDLSPMVVERR